MGSWRRTRCSAFPSRRTPCAWISRCSCRAASRPSPRRSSDATLATLTTRGSSTADLRGTGRRGTSVITAITPTGLTASARISLVPPAARLIVVSGGAQTGVAGSTLAQPFVVETQATDGGPVPNVAVAFRAVSAGGAVATTTATTDTSERASSAFTLGRTAGTYAFEATNGAAVTGSGTVNGSAITAATCTP